jgi:hypothetical protein
VWRALRYNRPAIAILGTGTRVNRLAAEEGLLPELHEIERYWDRGIFAIHNDLTTCLRHGDVTAITSRGNEIVEVKASPRGTRSDRWCASAKQRTAAITPTVDALIVLTNGGKGSTALGIHGVTAGLLVAAGLVLALG